MRWALGITGPLTPLVSAVAFIVIGTHGRHGMKKLLLGSVAERVILLAPCPVLTVRGT